MNLNLKKQMKDITHLIKASEFVPDLKTQVYGNLGEFTSNELEQMRDYLTELKRSVWSGQCDKLEYGLYWDLDTLNAIKQAIQDRHTDLLADKESFFNMPLRKAINKFDAEDYENFLTVATPNEKFILDALASVVIEVTEVLNEK